MGLLLPGKMVFNLSRAQLITLELHCFSDSSVCQMLGQCKSNWTTPGKCHIRTDIIFILSDCTIIIFARHEINWLNYMNFKRKSFYYHKSNAKPTWRKLTGSRWNERQNEVVNLMTKQPWTPRKWRTWWGTRRQRWVHTGSTRLRLTSLNWFFFFAHNSNFMKNYNVCVWGGGGGGGGGVYSGVEPLWYDHRTVS